MNGEDIEAWKKARLLVRDIYKLCNPQNYQKDYNLIDQTRKSAVSIMSNIAEGFARRTSKEFINFLTIAHASAAEVQSHLYIAFDQKYISPTEFSALYRNTDEVSKMIQGFINYLKTCKNIQLPNSKLPNSQT